MILKHINPLLSAELMTVMLEMGHGDEIVFADRNFPAVSLADRLICYNGVPITQLLPAFLYHFPIDYLVEHPVHMMRIPAVPITGKHHRRVPAILDEAMGKRLVGLLDGSL